MLRRLAATGLALAAGGRHALFLGAKGMEPRTGLSEDDCTVHPAAALGAV